MYENGRRVKGYQNTRLHKRKVKESYAKTYTFGGSDRYDWNYLLTHYKDTPRNGWHPLDYWKDYSLSEELTFTKNQTNKKLRHEFKNQSQKFFEEDEDFDCIPYLATGKYKKYCEQIW